MSKTIIIAEKPSVAQDIVRALTPVAGKFDKFADHFENERYVVTSAVGHLVEIKAPEEFENLVACHPALDVPLKMAGSTAMPLPAVICAKASRSLFAFAGMESR